MGKQYLEVRHPNVLNKHREKIPMGTIVLVTDLVMSARSVPRRIQQGWFVNRTVDDYAEQKAGGPIVAAPAPPVSANPDGLPSPDDVARMVEKLAKEEEPEPEPDPDLPDEVPDEVPDEILELDLPPVEEVIDQVIDEAVDEGEWAPVDEEEYEQTTGDPTRDGMTIEAYWDAAEKDPEHPRKRKCSHCGESRGPKSALFECCEDEAEWGLTG